MMTRSMSAATAAGPKVTGKAHREKGYEVWTSDIGVSLLRLKHKISFDPILSFFVRIYYKYSE